ncbi:hypothetical protein HQ393_01765 [Chitinibacter bivalviorum]|uniref:Uncharacterized protein n=1 Tax=Chitinibacter bivalviorum TaxID=2739434 RepID=A0A7H9BGK2_9NEIS|nr:hypothetical protein [Chitinibacter bivalviorum]QLG87071.1 hypothetical protein HQ393_01765 [Chitinibacter bivalviorum]
MNASFSDCWAWVFDYLAHRIDRAEAFPDGDKYGAANIACEIIKTLESRITARRYKPVSIYLRFGTTRVKQLRATVDAFPICIPCPLLRREREKVAAIALALDDAIAAHNQWFLDRGRALPSLGKDLAKNPVWARLAVASLHQSTTQRLCGTSCISEADLRMLSGAANLHDAAASVRSGDYQSAIGQMTGAALLVSGADLPNNLLRKQAENTALSQEVERRKNTSRQNGATGGRATTIDHDAVLKAATELIESGRPANTINSVLATRFGCTSTNIRKIRNKKTQPTQG